MKEETTQSISILPAQQNPKAAVASTHILVIGASGDVAKKKIYPALFELYHNNFVEGERNLRIHGFARSQLSSTQFRNQIKYVRSISFFTSRCINSIHNAILIIQISFSFCRPHLRPVIHNDSINPNNVSVDNFLSTCHYYRGRGYDDEVAMTHLLSQFTMSTQPNILLVYLAIPPNLFPVVTLSIRNVIRKTQFIPFDNIRIILEKPFGHDTASCQELITALEQQKWRESNLFRIDHYLGKTMIRNILHLRHQLIQKASLPAWSNRNVQSVHILLKETLTIDGRGGYYDTYGVVRDVIQNHLLQILALLTMELPKTTKCVRDYKVQLLEQLSSIQISDCIFGQYEGYTNDATIPDKNSKTPTYACIRLFTTHHNPTWYGVPFYLEAGKALDVAVCEVRIKFKDNPVRRQLAKTLVIRIQPSPSVYVENSDEFSGRGMKPRRTINFTETILHDSSICPLSAYATLILDALHGSSTNFVRADELLASWRIFTPLLHEYERNGCIRPLIYAVGSSGPAERFNFLQAIARSSL